MALLFIDGFGHYSQPYIIKKYEIFNSNTGTAWLDISPTGGRRGDPCLRLNNGGHVAKVIDPVPTAIAGFAFYSATGQQTTVNSYTEICSFREGIYHHVTIHLTGDGTVYAYNVITTTLLGKSAPGKLQLDAWHYVEVKCTVSDTAGVVQVKIDGELILDLSAVDTRNGGTGLIDNVRIHGNSVNKWFDDFYICDTSGTINNDFLGDVYVDTLFPNAVGSYTQFTASAAADNWTLVDEATPDTADYVSSATVGAKDTYGLTNLDATERNIYGVQAMALVHKDNPNYRQSAILLKSGTTEVEGAAFTLGNGVAKYDKVLKELDPATAAAWTATGVNALEVGTTVKA